MRERRGLATNKAVSKTSFRQLAYRLSRSDILFWTLPLLMVILTVGTIAQKDLGIYAAQKAYFSSFITFIGPLPFPGGATLMSVLFINMLMKFLLFSEWRWVKSGVILTHFGVLVLIFGGFVTAFTTAESYMIIEQGKSSNIVEDYYQREFVVTKDAKKIYALPHQDLKEGLKIESASFPFAVKIETYCFNCKIERRSSPEGWQGPGQFMQLIPDKTLPVREENLTGIEFELNGDKYVTFDKFPKPPEFDIDGHKYSIEIRHAERELPFTLSLEKFQQGLYPGSDTAKSYRSDLTILDGNDKWKTFIEMNKPLRYNGFTFYQSSFDMSGTNPFTILNVVENSGRLFPYVASLLMSIGLILHLIIRLRLKRDV